MAQLGCMQGCSWQIDPCLELMNNAKPTQSKVVNRSDEVVNKVVKSQPSQPEWEKEDYFEFKTIEDRDKWITWMRKYESDLIQQREQAVRKEMRIPCLRWHIKHDLYHEPCWVDESLKKGTDE